MQMKKIFAVVATIVALCAISVLSSCSEDSFVGSNYDADTNNGLVTPVKEKSCKITGIKTPQASGAITRSARAAASEDFTKPDGLFEVTSVSTQKFVGCIDEDTVQTYEGKNRYRSYGVVNKYLYLRDMDKFMNTAPTITVDVLPDERTRNLVKNEGAKAYSLIEEQEYDSDITYVTDKIGNRREFTRCKDAWANKPAFVKRSAEDLQRDSAKWHFYRITDEFKPTLESGFNVGTMKISYIALKWTGKGDPDFPDDDWEVIRYYTKNEWLKYVDPNTANTGFEVYAYLSDGSEKFYKKKDVDLSNSIEVQKRDTITTNDFNWKSLDAALYNEGTDGALYQKKDSIWVQPLKRMYQTNVNKGSREYLLKREGRAYWTDPLGENHYFLDAEWQTNGADKGWEESSLSDDKTYKYTLLTSSVVPTYLEYPHPTKSELALRKLKDEGNKLIGYKIMNYNIRRITSITDYFTYAELWGIYAQGDPQKIGEIGTHTGVNVTTPAEQTIDVTDWNISDKTAQWYGEQRQTERRDTIKDGDRIVGIFHITPVKKNYVTQTNKSDDKFYVTWDKTITFTDEFGKEHTGFITLDPTPSDKGGVKTLVDLSDENDYQRKKMTTTMNLVVREDNADYSGTVIFRKPVEKEELVDGPTVTPSLKPIGNGMWTASLKINYKLKIAGPQEINVSQDEEWSITNEAKTHLILSSATANHVSIGNISWGTTTSTTPQTGVTLYTTTGSIKDHYTTLIDGYTTKKQTAKYTFTILGKEYSYDFPAPSDMTVAYKTSSLVNGNRTATEGNKNYDVYDHSGTVTATVTSTSDGNQSQDATDEKEIWIAKSSNPDFPFDGNGHAARANRFYTETQWGDGLLYSNADNYFIVAYFFNLSNSGTSEGLVDTKTYTYPKSTFVDPTNPYNAVMWDPNRNKAIPCVLTVDGDGWSLGSRYADGTPVTKRHKRQEAVNSGVKNLAEEDNATPSPLIATSWSEDTVDGHIYYHAAWHTTTHSMSHTVGYKAE